MDNKEIKTRAEAEQNRIIALLVDAGVSDKRMKMLSPVIINTAWMKAKLDDARDAIKNSQIVISYDNGGGQKGIRENPLFKGYEALWKSYIQGMDRILNAIPETESIRKQVESERAQTVLEIVKDRHRKKA